MLDSLSAALHVFRLEILVPSISYSYYIDYAILYIFPSSVRLFPFYNLIIQDFRGNQENINLQVILFAFLFHLLHFNTHFFSSNTWLTSFRIIEAGSLPYFAMESLIIEVSFFFSSKHAIYHLLQSFLNVSIESSSCKYFNFFLYQIVFLYSQGSGFLSLFRPFYLKFLLKNVKLLETYFAFNTFHLSFPQYLIVNYGKFLVASSPTVQL